MYTFGTYVGALRMGGFCMNYCNVVGTHVGICIVSCVFVVNTFKFNTISLFSGKDLSKFNLPNEY